MQSQISLEIIERLRVSTVRTILVGAKALGAKRGPRRVLVRPLVEAQERHTTTTKQHGIIIAKNYYYYYYQPH